MEEKSFLKDLITKAFGDKTTGTQWGAVTGTSGITLATTLLGFTMGGIPGALAGLAGGVVTGALLGPLMNDVWKNMGLPSVDKPSLPGLAAEAQADPDVAKTRTIEVGEPGTPLKKRTEMIVPNLERFKEVSNEAMGQVKDLAAKRVQIDALPHGDQRAGAITRLLEAESAASKLLANGQSWDDIAAKWMEKGGERDKLQQALAVATNATGKVFDPSIIPTPPMTKIKVPELSPALEDYALDMMRAEGKTRAQWETMRPQDKLNYTWNKLEDEAKANQPQWDKMGARLFDYFSARQSGSSVGNLTNSAAAWCVSWVSSDGEKYLNSLVNSQSDCLVKAKECVEKGDYAQAAGYARLGVKFVTDGGRLGFSTSDPEAKAAFEKLERYCTVRALQQDANTQREAVYSEIQRAEATIKNDFPKFIKDVEKLEARVSEMNAQLEQSRKQAQTQDVTLPTQAPTTPLKAEQPAADKSTTPSH